MRKIVFGFSSKPRKFSMPLEVQIPKEKQSCPSVEESLRDLVPDANNRKNKSDVWQGMNHGQKHYQTPEEGEGQSLGYKS